MFPNAEPSVTELSDFQTWLSAAKDEKASRKRRSDRHVTLLSHLHSLLTSSEGQVPNDIPHSEPTFRVFFLRRMTVCLQPAAAVKKPELVRGDKVVASGGDFVGLTGLVSQVAGDEIHVTLDAHEGTEGVADDVLFNIHDLVKRYDIGDSVAVAHGKEVGCSGIVVDIGDAACCNLPRVASLRLSRPQTLPPASSPSSTRRASSKRAWRIAATHQVRKSIALRPPARRV